jgi:hypothetical protein
MHAVHTFILYFHKIHFNTVFLSMHRSSEWSYLSVFLTKILYTFLISLTYYMPCPSCPWFDHPNNWFVCTGYEASQYATCHFFLGPNIHPSILLSYTLSVFFP